jgi:cell division protease FtsH
MAGTDRSETASEVKNENPGAKIASDLPELHLPGMPESEPV